MTAVLDADDVAAADVIASHEVERPGEVVAGGPPPVEPGEPARPSVRVAVAVAAPVLASAMAVGGIFLGPGGRVIAALAGVCGVALAYGAARLRPVVWINVVLFLGVFVVGLALVVPTGVANLGALR